MDDLRARALGLAERLAPTPANIDRVGRESSPEAARWAFVQWELRRRARTKFERAERMLFVREALEQATHEQVAAYHASRFPSGSLVADLTAGIGADLIALATRGPAVGYELDPERAQYARYNLLVNADPSSPADVIVADSLDARWSFEYAFADPARRVGGRRTLDPNDFSPNPVALAERMRGLTLGGIKLSPLLSDLFLESLGPGLEFVSFDGECREALIWCGSVAKPGRWAVHVESDERLPAGAFPVTVDEPDRFLFEADPAAIRAHSLGALCDAFGLRALGDSNGYLTGAELVESPWLKGYRVLDHGKADLKRTRAALRELNGATPEIKQRDANQDVAALRKQLASDGTRPVYVAIWPVGKSLRHTVMERARE